MEGVLLWDFDGTLALRPQMWANACRAALERRLGACPIDFELLNVDLGRGMPWHRPDRSFPDLHTPELFWRAVLDRVEAVLIQHGCTTDEAALVAEDVQIDIVDPGGYELFPDVREALDLAAGAGWHSAIVSNHIPELPSVVDGLGIADRFDWILTSGSVGYDKPHPRIFQLALERAQTKNVWMIGDSEDADCVGAAAVGVHAIQVRNSVPGHQPNASDGLAAVWHILNHDTGHAP